MCEAIGLHGAALVPDNAGVLTHCNAGGLATGGYGSAVGALRTAWERDLLSTSKRWKVAFLHRSPYGSSRHGGDETVGEMANRAAVTAYLDRLTRGRAR